MAFATLIATGAGGLIAAWFSWKLQSHIFLSEQKAIKEKTYISMLSERLYEISLNSSRPEEERYRYSIVYRELHNLSAVLKDGSDASVVLQCLISLIQEKRESEELIENDAVWVTETLVRYMGQAVIVYLTSKSRKDIDRLLAIAAELSLIHLKEAYGRDVKTDLLSLYGSTPQQRKWSNAGDTQARFKELLVEMYR